MTVRTLTIDGRLVPAREGETVLEVCRENGIVVPTLCHLDGLSEVGACRLCLVEVKGSAKLTPACCTPAAAGIEVTTASERLRRYRRELVELLFAERNHVCATCVANGCCELQDVAYAVGMDHVRYPYLHPRTELDASHPRFALDHGRCILCTRCVRVCDEIEGAHTWDVAYRGAAARIVADLGSPWGTSDSCTSCGKCVQACPTGALFDQVPALSGPSRRDLPAFLRAARERKEWLP